MRGLRVLDSCGTAFLIRAAVASWLMNSMIVCDPFMMPVNYSIFSYVYRTLTAHRRTQEGQGGCVEEGTLG